MRNYGIENILFLFITLSAATARRPTFRQLALELKELQPYHWTKAYSAEELEHWKE